MLLLNKTTMVCLGHRKQRSGERIVGLLFPETSHVNVIPSLKLTAKAPENRPGPNRKVVFQPSIFRGDLLVSGRVYV